MGSIPGQDLIPTIKCMICGRENAADRKFCENCKQKLHDPVLDKLRTALQTLQNENLDLRQKHASALDDSEQVRQQLEPVQIENQQLRQQLEPVQTANLDLRQKHASVLVDNQRLLQQLDATKDELATLKTAGVDPGHIAALTTTLAATKAEAATAKDEAATAKGVAVTAQDEAATHASRAETFKESWKSAEGKAVAFEKQLAAKAKELEDFVKKHKGENPVPYLKSIVAFITFLGSLAGYGTARYVQPKNDAADKAKVLVAQVADAQQQIGNLKLSLDSANAKADQVQNQSKTDLDSATQKTNELSAHEQQLQRQLNEANQRAAGSDQTQKQLKQELETASNRVVTLSAAEQQARRELAEANNQRASTSQTVGQLNAEITKLHAQSATTGSLIWSGNLTSKRTIEIKDGMPNVGALSGALPEKLCKISTQDPRVKIKNRPSKNHMKDLSFDVSGLGLVQVRIDWQATQ